MSREHAPSAGGRAKLAAEVLDSGEQLVAARGARFAAPAAEPAVPDCIADELATHPAQSTQERLAQARQAYLAAPVKSPASSSPS